MPRKVLVEVIDRARADLLPRRMSPRSPWFAVRAAESTELVATRSTLVHTGLKASIPTGSFLEVTISPPLQSKGALVLNSPGTIDSDYRGEILVPMSVIGGRQVKIRRGSIVARMRLVETVPVVFRGVHVGRSEARSGPE